MPAFDPNHPLGTDISATDDLTLSMAVSSGERALAEALVRRLLAPLSSLFYDLDYGGDVLRTVGATVDNPGSIQARSEDECMKDERVEDAESTITYDAATSTLSGTVLITPVTGEAFEFTFNVRDKSVEVIVGDFSIPARAF